MVYRLCRWDIAGKYDWWRDTVHKNVETLGKYIGAIHMTAIKSDTIIYWPSAFLYRVDKAVLNISLISNQTNCISWE